MYCYEVELEGTPNRFFTEAHCIEAAMEHPNFALGGTSKVVSIERIGGML